ncbi:YeeE/YedE family protein [Acidovorax sp. SUPP2522]|uniref:YeeE/YedE family protein n=1 Tax=unclassified Acidovorax TaxID=2684926 RepID=UPI002349A3BE|nr:MULTISPECIES: YeeE/YedE family protein [unclassified Acidovorax]WCN00085.1 YeeE/YedE family protein [Acidovorax sp. GBBC 1281]GKT16145.1 YeeE/YedE family protein [Acidovorax sp. SUPP2522]
MRVAGLFSWGLLVAVGVAALALQAQPGGRTLAFSLAVGAVLGVVLQRSRFCFYCHARDWFADGNPRGLLALVLALAVGTVGYTVVLGSWVPVPTAGQLPADMHIGPVSMALVAAGLAFGAGMVVSGSCISAHWYRLAEGSPVAPFALIGSAGGFILGFRTWNPLYSASVADAPVVWLPAHLGYGGALALQLGVLAAIAAWLWRGFAREAPGAAAAPPGVPGLREAWRRLWVGRWPYWAGGLAVGIIGAFVIVRMRPLGVTATLGSAARSLAQGQGWIPDRLDGLDSLAGCATALQATWLTPNAVLIGGLVAGAFIAALASRQFAPRWPTGRDAVRGLGGSVLLGWGAMTGLGCTVGTLLSGGMAGALSGWVFGAAVFVAVWGGVRAQAWRARRAAR